MRFATLALVLAVPALAAQDNEAEKLFRQVEKQIAEAKSLKVASEVIVNYNGRMERLGKQGLTLVGNKFRLQMERKGGTTAKGDGTVSEEGMILTEIVSDGKAVKTTISTRGKPAETPATPASRNLDQALRKTVARVGFVFTIMLGRQEGEALNRFVTSIEERFPVSDFKFGPAEKVGGRDTKVITYKFGPKRDESATVTLWVDAKTLVPLKHTVVLPGDDRHLTATYTTFDLNPKIDAKTFELPK